ncbi:hypothetical protein [Enterocloster clostridioformis]|uniref:hypothetical protein n=1 Tax=Enterocloster clostridioformis TaxID=1531 RepID=UPI0022DEF864|nr:hypothetical protein [Enterocloster clostridioformis]
MKKRIVMAALAVTLTLSMSVPAFAGQWQQNTTGWWYQNDDGGYPSNSWQWIDGKCYYFDGNGYMLANTTTPDGYNVDVSGAWTVDGVVQTQSTTTGEQTQSTVQVNMDIPNVAGTYTGFYDGKQIKAVFEQDGDTIWAEIDYFLKDSLPPFKGDGLFANDFYSFQFSGTSSLLFKDLTSGESVYFVKH